MKSFDRWFSEQAAPAPDEPDLPDGLYMRNGTPHFECWGCKRDVPWEGDVEDYSPHEAGCNMGGCSPYCIP